MTRLILPAIAALLALAATASMAETVYRCGNVYTQTPCAAGRAIEVDDARSAAERDEALRIASNEQGLGDRMERRRLNAEARLRPALAANLGPTPNRAAVVKPVVKKRRSVHARLADEVIAVDPSTLKRRR